MRERILKIQVLMELIQQELDGLEKLAETGKDSPINVTTAIETKYTHPDGCLCGHCGPENRVVRTVTTTIEPPPNPGGPEEEPLEP